MFTQYVLSSNKFKLTFQICYSIFIIFIIPQALANNFSTLIISRIFAGAFGGTVQNAAEGVAANLFKTSQERLTALTVYIFTLLAGVTLGPVLGSVVAVLNWRWYVSQHCLIQLMIQGILDTTHSQHRHLTTHSVLYARNKRICHAK